MHHHDEVEKRNEHVDMTTQRSPEEHAAPAENGEEHGKSGGIPAMGGIAGATAGLAAGAIAEGATAGAALGAIGGPVGMVGAAAVGAVVGAVGGALAGAGVEHSMRADADSREVKDREDAPPADAYSPRPFTTPIEDLDEGATHRH